MRAMIVLALASLAIPLAFLSPLLGLAAYCWLAYMRPQEMAWGIDQYSLGLYTAIALFLGLFVRLKLAFFQRNTVTSLIFALWAWWVVTTLTAFDQTIAMEGLRQISTIFLICLVTTGLCTTKSRLRLILLAIVGSLAFHGVKHGIYGLVHPGANMDQGIGGMMSGNNENAIAFTFALPCLFYAALEQKRSWRRIAMFAATGLTAAAIVFSHSRAGFLGLVAAGLVMVWRTRARKVAMFVVAPLLVAGFFLLAPDTYLERVGNIYVARDTDMSIIYRLQAWESAAGISATLPLTGIGPRNFLTQFQKFPHTFDMPRMEIHNTYLEFTTSSGLPGLALYLLLVVAAFRACSAVQKDVALRGDPRLSWFTNAGRGIQASMAGFLVASTFGSLMHFDLMYHFCALAACLPVAYRHEVESLTDDEVPEESPDDPVAVPTAAPSRYEKRPALDRPAPLELPDFNAPPPPEPDPVPVPTCEEPSVNDVDDVPADERAPLDPEDDLLAILARHAEETAWARDLSAPWYHERANDEKPEDDAVELPSPAALVDDAPRWYRDAELQGKPRPIVVRPDLRPDLAPATNAAADEHDEALAPASFYEALPDADGAALDALDVLDTDELHDHDAPFDLYDADTADAEPDEPWRTMEFSIDELDELLPSDTQSDTL